MNCCNPQKGRNTPHSWWRGASGCVGSGTLLVLLPKCPLCIVGYLTLWTGASAAMSVAMHLRPLLESLFLASAVLLLVQCLRMRTRHAAVTGRNPARTGGVEKRNEQPQP